MPRTDAGALVQAAAAAAVFVVVSWRVRRHRELLTFVVGLASITFAWFALRTVH